MSEMEGLDHVLNGVYISGTRAIFYLEELRNAGTTHILKLYFDEPEWPDDFVVCDNALDDGVFIGREAIQRGVSFIQQAVDCGHKVLVVCGLGISRSATFVLAYLLETQLNLPESFRLLRATHPVVSPARAMWESLFTHYHFPYSLEDVENWS